MNMEIIGRICRYLNMVYIISWNINRRKIMSNLSHKKREEMLEYLNHLKEIHTDDESRIALGKIETALTEKNMD